MTMGEHSGRKGIEKVQTPQLRYNAGKEDAARNKRRHMWALLRFSQWHAGYCLSVYYGVVSRACLGHNNPYLQRDVHAWQKAESVLVRPA